MLKALLHRKLQRRLVATDEDDSDADGTTPIEPTRREDPLTATIFERLAYLPPNLAWNILRGATKPLGNGPSLPADAPSGAPTWSFWPSLRPGADGRNKQRMEPDVLASWGDSVLVFEAKHREAQHAPQWVEQVRAIRAAPEFTGKRLWFIAVGGIAPHEHEALWASARNALSDALPSLLAMRWDDLRSIIDQRRDSSNLPEQSAVLNDIAAALEMWGYRKKTWFSSLRGIGPTFQSERAMSVLQAWRIR